MAQPTRKQKTASRPSVLSEEKIVDSDSDDQEAKKSIPNVVVPQKFQIEAERSSRDSLKKDQKLKVPVLKSDSETESGEGEMVEEEEANEDESENDSEASSLNWKKRAAPTRASAPARKKARPIPPTAIAPKAFKPPNGFEKTTFLASEYASDSLEFLKGNISSKQVWHITLPASVNLADIKPFGIQDLQSGKPVFSKNGVDYGFLTGSHKTERLLLVGGENFEYTPAKAHISGTYHLRELGTSKARSAADADKEIDSISFTAISTVPPKKPREQPAGMRMRYQPYGSTPTIKQGISPTSTPPFRMPRELPQLQLDKSEKTKVKQDEKAKERSESNEADAMDIDPRPDSAGKNPSPGTPAKSASDMAEATFEAVTEPLLKEKKRKKKKHKIAAESA